MSVRKGSKIIAGAYAVIKPDVYVKTEVDDLLDKKQDKLIAGTNIFIGDDNVISATGGGGGYINVVQETGDSTDDVMSQASVTHELEQKVNTLDLADIAFTSDYNDLSNTPDLATYTKTEDLAEVALTGDYDDLGNTPDLTLYAKTEDLSKVAVSNNYEDLDDKPNLNVYDTVVSVNNKLSFKQDNLKAGYGISIEDNTISNTVDTVEWGKIIGDISTQEDLQGEFTAIRNTIKDSDDNSLNKTQVTNCLLEVPQRIKYDLTDGILTIKAGSVAIVPYGTEDLTADYPVGSTFINEDYKIVDTQFVDEKFFVWIEAQSDKIVTYGTVVNDLIGCLTLDAFALALTPKANVTSGNAPASSTARRIWYDITTNFVKTYSPSSSEFTLCSLPITSINCIEDYKFTINQVFNGMGYMGTAVWVDRGVKGLIPNGRNEDGTLKNIEFTTDKVLVYNDMTNNSLNYAVINYNNGNLTLERSNAPYTGYNPITNLIYRQDGLFPNSVIISTVCCSTTSITSFNPKQPLRIVDWYDLINKEIGKPQISLDNYLPSGCVWLEGATVSRTSYANLFAIYGTTYGAGDGSTTFVLPDFRNRAIWGSDGFGYLSAGLPNITGSVDAGNGGAGQGNGCGNLRTGSGSGVFAVSNDGFWNNNAQVYSSGYSKTLSFNASRNNSIYGNSSTVQPPAIKVRVYTRYQ